MGMIGRRFALALGLLVAFASSQLPEFVQQYRQRLGGAIDEVRRSLSTFEAEAKAQSLGRDEAIARLEANADPLAQARGHDLAWDATRERRLAGQERDFASAGPVSQYWVFFSELDPTLAGRTYAIYQPAIPASSAGLAAGAAGLALGWGGAHVVAAPFRRRQRRTAARLA